MSSELAVISPTNLGEAKEMALTLAKATMVPTAFRDKPADVMAVVMAGAELGLAPMQSLRGIVMIEGKPTLSADAMAALVMGRGDTCEYLRCVKTTAEVATYETKRKGHPTPTTHSFTIGEAEKAGLKGKGNWSKYPNAMLRARALSGIARMVYPDILMGVYDPDELDSEPRPVTVTQATIEAPRPSPPTDAQFAPDADDALAVKLWVSVAAGCADEPSLLIAWKTLTKEQQASKPFRDAYVSRKNEISPKKLIIVDQPAETEKAS